MTLKNIPPCSNYEALGYHGTSKEATESILVNHFQVSRGNDHWLGEGAYFFEDGISNGQENAVEWAKVSAWDNAQRKNSYNYFSVISASISLERLWNLTSEEGLFLFEHSRKELAQRGAQPCKQTSGRQFDNAVIEFAAKLLNFDGIKSWFHIKLTASDRKFRVQSGIPNVTVLCVRDPRACISLDQIEEVDKGWVTT